MTAADRDAPGAFDVHGYTRAADARAALEHARVAGVLELTPAGAHALLAPAYGAAPTEAVSAAFTKLAAARHARLTVTDVKPLSSGDPRGIGMLFTVVGTLLPSVIFALVLSLLGRRIAPAPRWLAVAAFAVGGALISALTVDTLIGAFPGSFLEIAAVVSLLALAVAAAIHGFSRLPTPAGLVLVVLLVLPVGLSASGGAVTYHFEPAFFRAVSQLLPPGAGLTALRNAVYFDWSQTAGPLLVLAGWALLGVLAGAAGDRSRART